MQYSRPCQWPLRAAQRGVVLVVALIFLLLITILAIAASGRSLLQERMAGGLRNAQLAQFSGETALRGAEWGLWKNTSNLSAPPVLCGTGLLAGHCYKFDATNKVLYDTNGVVTKFRKTATWSGIDANSYETYRGASKGTDYTAPTGPNLASAKLARNPIYIVEDLGLELPPGVSGGLHESGVTGPNNQGPGINTSRHVYRVTARSVGANDNSVRILETTFAAKGTN